MLAWRLPPELRGFRWLASPLTRCTETAALLGLETETEPRLIEMDWGRWEGRTLAELRADPDQEMTALEARGLDLQPPAGESPRAVQRRLAPLLAEIAAMGVPTGGITHKGVIRALLALATGWTMVDPAPAKLDWAAAHEFWLEPGGALRVVRLNRPLAAATADLRA